LKAAGREDAFPVVAVGSAASVVWAKPERVPQEFCSAAVTPVNTVARSAKRTATTRDR
jgi:hypothetical protein